MAELRKEMNEKLEKMMREVKNSRRTQSISSKRNNGQTMPPKHINKDGGEEKASDTENQENRTQDNPFRPSETNELRTPIQQIPIENLDLDDTVIINGNRAKEDYHSELWH